MTLARAWQRLALVALAAITLAGCSSLPFGKKADDAAPSPAAAASAAEARADYRLDVQAPGDLKKLLANYLDLARFQNAPAADAIDEAELERLRRVAPAQARGLLETEGYFNAVVMVDRIDEPGAAKPLIRVVVEPGPRTRIEAVEIDAVGELKTRADAGDTTAADELARLKSRWPLRVGDAFRESAWSGAKTSALAALRADGYANADWARTSAEIDAPANTAKLSAEVASGPLYRLGPMRITGLQRYDAQAVRNLAEYNVGEPYSEQKILDFEERLRKLGLFEGAAVEIDPALETATAAPVNVRLREQPLQQATFGIGYSANTGPRLSVEHTHRKAFGFDWIAKNKLQLGPNNNQWEGDLTSYPREDLYRNFVGAGAQRLRVDNQTQTSANLRAGRYKEETRIDRRYFVELAHARVDGDVVSSSATAGSVNYHWVYRDIDNLLLPSKGLTLSTQSAAGLASGRRTVGAEPEETARGPFGRLYARATFYQPFGGWFGTARVEAGQVFTRSVVGIPDTLLFRAGGEGSVRGYGYRSLGPEVGGETVGGRALLTGSIEVAHPIVAKYPEYLGAVFIDAGDAADRWTDLKPVVGYGVGARWRSPVGPLALDLAYGHSARAFRVHLSVGVTF
jgi:translocation and assembly module TamA